MGRCVAEGFVRVIGFSVRTNKKIEAPFYFIRSLDFMMADEQSEFNPSHIEAVWANAAHPVFGV